METAILIPIVTAISALLGVALTAYVQLRNQRVTQRFELTSDAAKHERERADRAGRMLFSVLLMHISCSAKLLENSQLPIWISFGGQR